jgi:uncharacterized protein (DUF2147 family)
MRVKILLSFFLIAFCNLTFADENSDKIIGKWISIKGDLIVQVYKEKNLFKAKVVWFDDNGNKKLSMNTRTDFLNPDPVLQKRKIIGLEILSDLKYNRQTNRWEDGIIYDPQGGKKWKSFAFIDEDGELKVKGYWKFEFISRTISFRRIDQPELKPVDH